MRVTRPTRSAPLLARTSCRLYEADLSGSADYINESALHFLVTGHEPARIARPALSSLSCTISILTCILSSFKISKIVLYFGFENLEFKS